MEIDDLAGDDAGFLDHDFGYSDDLGDSTDFDPFDFNGDDWEQADAWAPWDDEGNLVEPFPEPVAQEVEIGDPDGSGWSMQTTSFTCAVVSQKMILDEFGVVDPSTGQPLSEAQLVYDATANGWLTSGGTSPDDMGRLLEHYGVPCHHGHGVDNLIDDLAQGRKAIVDVDSEELWNPDSWVANELKDLFGDRSDHAMVFKGVTRDPNGNPIMVVNDPGDPMGAGREYPLEDFMDAWQDGGFHYVATDSTPPGLEYDDVFGAGFDVAAGRYEGSEGWFEQAAGKVAGALESHAGGPLREVAQVGVESLEKLTEAARIELLAEI